MDNLDRAQRQYDRAEPPDLSLEDWEPVPVKQLSDEQIEAWIVEFADTGYIINEFGVFASHFGTVAHAVAQQWVADKER